MIKLKGILKQVRLYMVSATKVHKSLKESFYGFIGQFFSSKVFEKPKQIVYNLEVNTLLEKYQEVFA
jgi:hypothetical protein